jgi:hypothetical protein
MTSSLPEIRESLFSPRLLLGLGVALFGAVLMLDRLGLVDAGSVLRFWPLIVIAIGLQQFFNPREHAAGRRVPVNGIIWMAIGGVLLLNSFDLLHVSIWRLFWPAILIAFGVRLMMRPALRTRHASTRLAHLTLRAATSERCSPFSAARSGFVRHNRSVAQK